MRIYHKLHKNPCKSKRAKLIRNIGKKAVGAIRRRPNPKWKPAKVSGFRARVEGPGNLGFRRSAARRAFEDIFSYQQSLGDFHGLEVTVVGKVPKDRDIPGPEMWIIGHPWFPPDEKTRRREIHVSVCGAKKAREIGAVSVTKLSAIGRMKAPSFAAVEDPLEWEDEEEEDEKEAAVREFKRTRGIKNPREEEEEEEDEDEDDGKWVEKVKVKEGILIEDVGTFCCLGEKPAPPGGGKGYKTGILLCTGKQRKEAVRIGIGSRPEDVIRDLYSELEALTTQELALIDVPSFGRGTRPRPGVASKVRQAYLDSDPFSPEAPELLKKHQETQAKLHDIQGRKRKLKEEIAASEVVRVKPVAGTSLGLGKSKRIKARKLDRKGKTAEEILDEEEEIEKELKEAKKKAQEDRAKYGYRPTRLVSQGALQYRYGGDRAEKLAADEKDFKREYLMLTGGKLLRLGKGKKIPLNKRFLIGDTPLIGVIWDEVSLDRLTGIAMGKKGKYTWSLYDGAGNILNSGLVKRTRSGQGVSEAARQIKSLAAKVVAGGPGARELRGSEVGSIQEAITTDRPPPPLSIGEHLLVQFIPREQIRVTKATTKHTGTELKDIMRWGFPTTYGLVEFSRNRDGYHVTMKKPSGEKITASVVFKNMQKAVEYAMVMMQDLTGIKKWSVEEGPSWSGGGKGGRTRQRVRNPRGKLRLKRNPDLFETMKDILAPPFITRPKRRQEAVSASAIPEVGHHFRNIAKNLYGKEGFDFGFTFGVLRGIDTCGIKDLAERRRIRRYIEQQVMDAVYSLAVEAPARREGNPGRKKARKKTIRWSSGWDPKKNPDPIEALKDIVAPPFITRAKRKRESISVPELPDLKQHFIELAWKLHGQAAYDFGFVFGVLRGIDTCGLMKVGERRRIRRRIEQELMDAAYGLSVEVPGTREE